MRGIAHHRREPNADADPSGKLVGCLPVDTTVTIDDGPVFVQESTPSDAGNSTGSGGTWLATDGWCTSI